MINASAFWRGNRIFKLHRLRVAIVEPLVRFGDNDGVFAVRRPVHVVRIVYRHRNAGLSRLWVDWRQAPVGAPFGVIGDPQRL